MNYNIGILNKLNFIIVSLDDFNFIAKNKIKMVTIAPQFLSLSGTTPIASACEIVKQAQEKSIKVQILCDVIPFDDDFENIMLNLSQLIDQGANAVILQNFGLAQRLRQQYSKLDIIYDTKSGGNHLGFYQELQKANFNGAILSREIKLEDVMQIATQVGNKFNVQLYVFGLVQIFHSARNLLHNLTTDDELELLEPTREGEYFKMHNTYNNGVVMYYSKIINLSPYIVEIAKALPTLTFYIDYRQVTDIKNCFDIIIGKSKHLDETLLPNSDFDFKQPLNLNEVKINNSSSKIVGKVIAIARDEHVIIETHQKIICGAEYCFIKPDNKQFKLTFNEIYTWWGDKINQNLSPIIRVKWFKGACVGGTIVTNI